MPEENFDEVRNTLAWYVLMAIDEWTKTVPPEEKTGDWYGQYTVSPAGESRMTLLLFRARPEAELMTPDERINDLEQVTGQDFSALREDAEGEATKLPVAYALYLKEEEPGIWQGFKLEYFLADGGAMEVFRHSRSINANEDPEWEQEEETEEERLARQRQAVSEAKLFRNLERDMGQSDPSREDLSTVLGLIRRVLDQKKK